MKIGYFTDFHLHSETSKSFLTGSYEQLQLGILESMYADFIKRDIHTVLFAGDFFHTNDQPAWVVRQVIQILKKFDIKTVAVPGQHDVYQHNSKFYERSSLGILESALEDKFFVLTNGEQIYVGGVNVYGIGFNDKAMDNLLYRGETIDDPIGSNAPNVILAHESIGPENWGGKTATDLKVNELFSAVLLGDIHAGFEPVQLGNGVVVWNCGASSKRSWNDSKNVASYGVIEFERNETGQYVVSDIEHIPIAEYSVIEYKKVETNKTVRDAEVTEILSAHKKLEDLSELSAIELVREYVKENNLDESIIEIIKEESRVRK